MKYIIAIFFSFGFLFSSAQVKPGEYDHPGEIVTRDGIIEKGYIRVYANSNAPWAYQSKVRFMNEEHWAALVKTPKNKDFEKYDPKEILEYRLTDSGFVFRSQAFSDKSSISLDMLPKKYFMRVIEDGKIKVYHYYDAPSDVYVGTDEGYREMINESMDNYVLIQIGDRKLQNSSEVDIRKMIADCPTVLADYEAGKYGSSPLDNEKKKGLSKFISKVIDSNKMKNFIAPLVRDYNKCQKYIKSEELRIKN